MPSSWVRARRVPRRLVRGSGYAVALAGRGPALRLSQRLGAQAVDPARALGPDGDEAGLAQHLQVLGDRGLADPELLANQGHHCPRGQLSADGQLLQHAPAYRVTQHLERFHPAIVHPTSIISQDL
jgi:hypothetical protein